MRLPPFARLAGALACGLAATAASAALLSESSGTYACTYKHFGQCTEGGASVTLQGGQVLAVSFNASFCAKKNQAAGACTLDHKRGGTARWADEGRRAILSMVDPRQPRLEDELVVQVEDAAVMLDFSLTQPSSHCTGGGDLPEKIVIDPASKVCRVTF